MKGQGDDHCSGDGRDRGQVVAQGTFIDGLIADGGESVVLTSCFALLAESDEFLSVVLVVAAMDGQRGVAGGSGAMGSKSMIFRRVAGGSTLGIRSLSLPGRPGNPAKTRPGFVS